MAEYSVLIIDDDIWMQRILSKTFQGYGFTKTYLASNGFDGIALAVEHRPTLIILDILMPELTGHMTLKILKHIKITRDIPVVMVSALSDVENLGLAVKSGTAGFISKPFTRATVYEKLIDVFGKKKLEMIGSGEAIAEDDDYYGEPNYESMNQDYSNDYSDKSEPDSPENDAKKGELIKQYKEEEKRSIESIKKMLLKNKK